MALKRIIGCFRDQQGESARVLVLIIMMVMVVSLFTFLPSLKEPPKEGSKFSMAAPVVKVLSEWKGTKDTGFFRWIEINGQLCIRYNYSNGVGGGFAIMKW